MGRVARDDFSAQLPETGRGEFRRLAVDFNSMTRALHAARRGLRDDVAQATAALDDAHARGGGCQQRQEPLSRGGKS